MANCLIINFNLYNDSLQKGLIRGDNSFYIKVIVDGYEIARIDSSRRIKLPNGEHELQCILRFKCSTGVEVYHSDIYTFDINDYEDTLFTFNLYHLTYERSNDGFDFGPGNIPQRPPEKSGCYVATCAYGSYDCPEVWTLRRYRDNTLAKSCFGRAFIKTYYLISPTIVKWFGKTKWFNRFIKARLDKFVKILNENGVENTPYEDRF